MPRRLTLEERLASRQAKRKNVRDIISLDDPDEVAKAFQEAFGTAEDPTTASNDYTNKSNQSQRALLDMRIRFMDFYEDVYKVMMRAGKFERTLPLPEEPLDYSHVPGLVHRLKAFLTYMCTNSKAMQGIGRPTQGTVVGWCDQIIHLVRDAVAQDSDTADTGAQLRQVLKYDGTGEGGVYKQVYNHASYLITHHKLKFRARDQAQSTGRIEVELMIDKLMERCSHYSSNSEHIIQQICILQIVFLTGVRIGSLVATDKTDELRQGLLQEHVSFTQNELGSYTTTLRIVHLKVSKL
jgi:hypothetical protein